MKLYIPTCTLNFNNIFSTESISPLHHYDKRGFGNKRFYSVPANSIGDVIILYSKFPRFQVENNDMENYPMVIEIETEDYPKDYFDEVLERNGIKVFICYNTIYLNPFHSLVYFDNYESRQGVLTKAEQSLENKLSKLYSANLLVKHVSKKNRFVSTLNFNDQESSDDFIWELSYIQFDLPENKLNYTEDIIIDRLKGFIYCYLIGANQSVSVETGKLKAIARNLRNTLSAVINSPDKRPTNIQDDILLKGINEFNRLYSLKDEDSIRNKQILENRLSSNPINLNVDNCITLLKSWNLYEIYCEKLNLKRVYDASELWDCLENPLVDSYSRVINNLQNAVKRIENIDLSSIKKHVIKNLILIEDNFNVKMLDDSYKFDFYQNLIRSQIFAEYLNVMKEKEVEEPLAQAFNGGRILKLMMGENWENSSVATYINSLLNHFNENTSFNLFSVESDVLVSFAAFCQKGDNIDRLSEYLIQCGVSDCRLAYGIYGATRGFASLPKTFTSFLINGDRGYYKEFFLNIYNQLFGVLIKDTAFFDTQMVNRINTSDSEISSAIIQNISKIEKAPSKQQNIINVVSQVVDLEESVQSPRAFMYIADNILSKKTKVYKALVEADLYNDTNKYTEDSFKDMIFSIIRTALPSKKQDRENIKKQICQILKLEAKRYDPEAFIYILDNFFGRNTKYYKQIIEIIQKTNSDLDKILQNNKNKLNSRRQNYSQENNLSFNFEEESKHFIITLNSVKRFNKEQQQRLISNWEYTQEQTRGDKNEHLKFFVNLCKKEGRGEGKYGRNSVLYNAFTEIIAKEIQEEIKRFYF